MSLLKFAVLLLFVWAATLACAADPPTPPGKVVLAIHGGVGTMTRAELTPEVERAYRADLERALRAGKDVLDGGGVGLDAVEAAFPVLLGTIRDRTTAQRRPFVRFFACEEDLSHQTPDTPLPPRVAEGEEPFMVVGAMAGG